MSLAKKQFNVNTTTNKLGKYDTFDGDRFKRVKNRLEKPKYNVLSGAAHEFVSNKANFRRQSMLPPQNNPVFNGANKAEYREGLAASPKLFYRQNGDFTHFSGLKVANNLISSKNFSQKMSSSLLK